MAVKLAVKMAVMSPACHNFGAKGYKSEEKGIKVIVFCRKDDFPSLFRGKLANFVRVNYNKVQPQHNKNGK